MSDRHRASGTGICVAAILLLGAAAVLALVPLAECKDCDATGVVVSPDLRFRATTSEFYFSPCGRCESRGKVTFLNLLLARR